MSDNVTNGADTVTDAVTSFANVKFPIRMRPIADLKPYAQNSRTHSKRQLATLRNAIREFGFGSAVGEWKDGTILAGHCRVEAAGLEGFKYVPTIDLSHLSFGEARAYVISDNKIADLAEMDADILRAELEDLQSATRAGDLAEETMQAIGFNDRDLMKYLPDRDIPDDALEARSASPAARVDLIGDPIAQPGDLWQLGKHRMKVSADPTEADWRDLMRGGLGALMIAWPPSPSDFGRFDIVAPHLAAGASHYIISTPGREVVDLQSAVLKSGINLRHGLIWKLPKVEISEAGGFYGTGHLSVLYAWTKGGHKFYGPHNEPTVWDMPAPLYGDAHPCDLPVSVVERVLRNSSKAGDSVIDPFGAAGAVLVACHRRGRVANVMASPSDADLILRRFESISGDAPKRIGAAS